MDQRPGLGARIRYAFYRQFSRGTGSLIVALALLSALIVVVAAWLVWLFRVRPAGVASVTFPEAVWKSLMRAMDPGAVGGDEGWAFRFAMLGVTIAGIFVLSTLIGVLTTGIEGRLETLRRGRTRVVETRHTILLGWSEHVFTIVSELVVANANQRKPCIVILSPEDKVLMEEEVRSRAGDLGNTRIVCRTGDPMEIADLDIVSVDTARSVIVLPPAHSDHDAHDAEVIKIVLALRNRPDRPPTAPHIVAPLKDARNARIAVLAGGDDVEWVHTGDMVARIVAQTCRQSGLSVVYTELMDFDGDEMYMVDQPELHGRTFGDALLAFETNAVMGLAPRHGSPVLNPPMTRVLEAGDRLVVLAADDDRILYTGGRPDVEEAAIVEAPPRDPAPERTLLLGWNWRGGEVLRGLDQYVAAGSQTLLVAEAPPEAEDLAARLRLSNQQLTVRHGDTTDRATLEDVRPEAYDHVIVISYSDRLAQQEADAVTLVTLLHLRDMADTGGYPFAVVSEMLDRRNRQLAEVTRADDFVVSDHFASLVMAQVSENRAINAIFADMFDADGSEIYVKPAIDYVRAGAEVSFATVVAAAGRRGECAIGYRIASRSRDADDSYGVVVNPAKSSRVTFAAGDRVVVVAES